MTIQDLMDQFEIQGPVLIKQWNTETDDYNILFESFDFGTNIPDTVLNKKITYMYSILTYNPNYNNEQCAQIVIEVE